MERRTSICSTTAFTCPLIVYKITDEEAYKYSKLIIEYFLDSPLTNVIYVEDVNKFSDYAENKNNVKLGGFVLDQTEPDVCIVIGGDGTTLWANYLFKTSKRPPFLTFNMGHLGYMAIYSVECYKQVLDELTNANKVMVFEKRSTLMCKFILGDDKEENILALNDIIIERGGDKCHVIHLRIFINDEPLSDIRCDGLILSTSTGSTAYSLSAGGTIVHYDVDSLILNAICPHSLSFRPIAFPRDITVKVYNCSDSNKGNVVHDGINSIPLSGGQGIEICLSDTYVNFIVLEKFCKNRLTLWKEKLTNQLGWNTSFKNTDGGVQPCKSEQNK